MGLELRDVPVQVADDAELPLRLEGRVIRVRVRVRVIRVRVIMGRVIKG